MSLSRDCIVFAQLVSRAPEWGICHWAELLHCPGNCFLNFCFLKTCLFALFPSYSPLWQPPPFTPPSLSSSVSPYITYWASSFCVSARSTTQPPGLGTGTGTYFTWFSKFWPGKLLVSAHGSVHHELHSKSRGSTDWFPRNLCLGWCWSLWAKPRIALNVIGTQQGPWLSSRGSL